MRIDTPTIGDFSNATHTHQGASTGGVLALVPLVSVGGTVAAMTEQSVGYTLAGGTTVKTLTVDETSAMSSKTNRLTAVATQTSNYTANANEFVPCNISAGGFAVTLPAAPADGTRVKVQVLTVGAGNTLEVKTGGSDKFFVTSVGPTSLYMYLYGDTQEFQYQASGAFWNGTSSAPSSNFANNFPGISASTPIDNTLISINTTTRVLKITAPTNGYFNIVTDGNGVCKAYRKTGAINFPAFTDTSGSWYFYFNQAGTAVTTQTAWTTDDFNSYALVYRMVWNATLYSFTVTAANATVGATYTNNGKTYTVLETIAGGTTLKMSCPSGDPQASGVLTYASGTGDATINFSAFSSDDKLVAQYVEYHVNDIAADTHQWFHLQGALWMHGFNIYSNALASGAPNVDGRNTVISLDSGHNVDDNLEYIVTSTTPSAPTNPWEQDLGNITPASITSSNSGQFKIFIQNAGGLLSFLPATRFPFAWDSTTNIPQYITSTGVRTTVANKRFMVNFIYATQNPVKGEALKVISATQDFTSIVNARAFTWTDLQNTYPNLLGTDGEIRPLYRLIHEVHSGNPNAYTSAEKFAVLRETQDLRKAAVTSTSVAAGSLPASSVTTIPSTTLVSTNVQSALTELDLRNTWQIVTADASLAIGSAYLANKGTLLTMTLPVTAVVGTMIRLTGMNAGLWKIAQNASQYINFGNQTTTVGITGYLASVLAYDSVMLVCHTEDTGWVVVSSVGNITVV